MIYTFANKSTKTKVSTRSLNFFGAMKSHSKSGKKSKSLVTSMRALLIQLVKVYVPDFSDKHTQQQRRGDYLHRIHVFDDVTG